MCQLEQVKKLAATFPELIYTKGKYNYNRISAKKPVRDLFFVKPLLMGCNRANTNALKIGIDSRRKT